MKSLAIFSTQNVTTQTNSGNASNAKVPESEGSFKQVLSQKVTPAPKQEAQPRHDKVDQAQTSERAPSATDQVDQVDAAAADQAESMEFSATSAKGLKLRLSSDERISVKKVTDTEDVPQDENAAALVASLQLPTMGVKPVDAVAEKTDTSKELSASTENPVTQAVTAHQKNAAKFEGQRDKQADNVENWAGQATPDQEMHAMPMDNKAEKFSEQVNAKIAEKIQVFNENQTAYAVGKSSTEASPKLTEITAPLPMATTQALAEATPSSVISPAVGQSGWKEAVNQKVVWMVGAQEQTATLTLNPPDMGPLQVVVSVNNDKADTTFVTDNPDVRKALQDGLADLRHQLDQAGVTLGQTNVSTNQQYQDFRQSSGERYARQPASNSASHAASPALEHASARSAVVRTNLGLVDTFA